MNCKTCKFHSNLHCNNPKNYQPQCRQYLKVKNLSPRFFPIPPSWCKGWESKVSLMYCIACKQIVNEQIHVVIYNARYDDFDWCNGPFAYCPPPPALTDLEWEELFQQEPSVI